VDNLGDRALKLLGKSNEDPLFDKFRSSAQFTSTGNSSFVLYFFHSIGIHFDYGVRCAKFVLVSYQIDTASTREGPTKPCRELPVPLAVLDSREDVRRKLGMPPSRSVLTQPCPDNP
jgi:hypothetical protein